MLLTVARNTSPDGIGDQGAASARAPASTRQVDEVSVHGKRAVAARAPGSGQWTEEAPAMEEDVALDVNGETPRVHVDPGTPLLYVLRNDLGLPGAKFGCGLEQCGACKVLVDGEALPTASVPGTTARSRRVRLAARCLCRRNRPLRPHARRHGDGHPESDHQSFHHHFL